MASCLAFRRSRRDVQKKVAKTGLMNGIHKMALDQ